MTKMSKTVVFFGSGPVAAAALDLLQKHTAIEAVITKPSTRNEMSVASPDATPVYTVGNRAELSSLIASKKFVSPVAVLIDFGIIVDQNVIDYFPLGIVNSHFSLLPEWRGADPITFSILSGQEQTGVSLMLLVAKMDEGPLLAQSPLTISPGTTTPKLTQELIELSDSILAKILPLYVNGKISPVEQEQVTIAPSKIPSYSRKLLKQDGVIDCSKPAAQLEREIRAYLGWPGSRTSLAGKEVIVTRAHVVPVSGKPGDKIVTKRGLTIVTSDQGLAIDSLKPAGKPEMDIASFLAGYGSRV